METAVRKDSKLALFYCAYNRGLQTRIGIIKGRGAMKRLLTCRPVKLIVNENNFQVTTALDDLLLHVKTSPKLIRTTQENYEYEQILNQSRKIITYQVCVIFFQNF